MAPSSTNQLVEMFGQLLSKLDGIGDLKTQVGILANQIGLLTDSHNELKAKVVGNGKPGLTDRMRDLEEDCEKLDQWKSDVAKEKEKAEFERQERSKEMRGLRITIIASVIVFVVTSLINLCISYLIAQHDSVDKVLQLLMAHR